VSRDKGNLISGVCLGAFGIYVISVAMKLPYVAEVGPGPGFFPLWLGIGMVIFSTCVVFVAPTAAPQPAASETPPHNVGRAMAAWLALMVSIALYSRIGFGLSFVLLTVFLILALDRRPALLAIGVGVGLALAFYLIFTVALNVSLPVAPWGF
jgi:putative tricarboxylic transport membrane protein